MRPFSAWRPADALAARVIAPPYDVLTLDECLALASDPLHFVHVTRSEVDLSPGEDAHGDAAYRQARVALDALVAQGTLKADDHDTYYLYGQRMGSHRQVGFLALVSVDEYDRGLIKKHELTRPDKEDDRTRHMEALDAQVGLVFLAFRATAALRALEEAVTSRPPCWVVTTEDGVEHALWVAPDELVEPIRSAFAEVPALYVADGHHRSAAASRVHQHRGDEASATFLAGLFPDDRLQVMAYNRIVADLGGRSEEAFLRAVAGVFEVAPGQPTPARRGEVSMYVGGRWYRLTMRAGRVGPGVVERLDVSVLQDHLLAPLLGIDDPRRSERIEFVGGIRGAEALVRAVDARGGVAFSMYPTGLDQLFEVADAGGVMPPKSTWFEPKLREGVVVRPLR